MLHLHEHIGGYACCRADDETLADAFEALVGAIYLDSGLEAASKFIIALAEVSVSLCMCILAACSSDPFLLH